MPYPVDKTFSILLALATGPATGAEVGHQVTADTLAANYMKPSSLYFILEKMVEEKLIEHAKKTDESIYKPLCLTPKGWKVLERAVPQLENQLRLTRERIDAKRYH